MFTFGSGQYGQLGHNSFNDEVRPRLVAELWRVKVTRIACGWYGVLLSEPHFSVFMHLDSHAGKSQRFVPKMSLSYK